MDLRLRRPNTATTLPRLRFTHHRSVRLVRQGGDAPPQGRAPAPTPPNASPGAVANESENADTPAAELNRALTKMAGPPGGSGHSTTITLRRDGSLVESSSLAPSPCLTALTTSRAE